jgi:hypothetical protein
MENLGGRCVELFKVYAKEFLEAGAPDGDRGTQEDIPALVFATAVKRGCFAFRSCATFPV